MRTQEPQPRLRPTSLATLFVAALAAGAGMWWLIGEFYSMIPPLPWLLAFTLGLLAFVEAVTARATKARIDRRPGTEPVEPLVVARYAVLAKGSSLTGAIFTGAYAAYLLWLWIEWMRRGYEASDTFSAVAGFIASLLLVGAALWLERSCRVPKPPDEAQAPEPEDDEEL